MNIKDFKRKYVERLIKDFASVTLGNWNIMCNMDMSPSSFNYVTVFQTSKLKAVEKS
jgi:hypothetical protein